MRGGVECCFYEFLTANLRLKQVPTTNHYKGEQLFLIIRVSHRDKLKILEFLEINVYEVEVKFSMVEGGSS